jgi:hypothetical protein
MVIFGLLAIRILALIGTVWVLSKVAIFVYSGFKTRALEAENRRVLEDLSRLKKERDDLQETIDYMNSRDLK